MIDSNHKGSDLPPGYHQVSKQPSLLSRIIGSRKPPSPAPKQEGHESTPPLSDISLVSPGSAHSRLLNSELAGNIRSLIPPRVRLYDEWELVYALDRDGISLNTLYHRSDPEFQHQQLNIRKARTLNEKGFAEDVVKKMVQSERNRPITFGSSEQSRGHRPHGYVLIIQDEKKNKFGCYLNEHLRAMDHKRYYGNGECFLWKCEWYDESKRTGGPSQREQRFKAFMYTGINENMIYSNHNYIAIGSSHGQNGLWIDSSLYLGVSYPCETFGNEILNHTDNEGQKYGKFKIMGLEVWRVGALE